MTESSTVEGKLTFTPIIPYNAILVATFTHFVWHCTSPDFVAGKTLEHLGYVIGSDSGMGIKNGKFSTHTYIGENGTTK